MNPKDLFRNAAATIRRQSESTLERVKGDSERGPVHYEPPGQSPGAVNTACGLRAAASTTSREASVTRLDCLDAMDQATGKHEARRRPIRILRFSLNMLVDVMAKVELEPNGFRVLELTMFRGHILNDLSEVSKIINGIIAALRDIGDLQPAPLQSAMSSAEDPEPFDEATGPSEDREDRREYEREIEGCRDA